MSKRTTIAVATLGLLVLIGPSLASADTLIVDQISRLPDPPSNSVDGRVISDPVGIDCGSDCSGTYNTGTSVELTAAPIGIDEFFRGWIKQNCGTNQVNGLANPLTIVMSGLTNSQCKLNADFQKFTDRVLYFENTGNDNDGIIWTPAELVLDAALTIGTPIPQQPTAFFDENGNGYVDLFVVNNPGLTLYRRHPANLPTLYLLTVNNVGENGGSGRVTSAPAGIDCGFDCWQWYPASDQVSLTATPDSGSIFVGWSGTNTGTCNGLTNPCAVQMDDHKRITATFRRDPVPDHPITYILSVVVNGTGSGVVTGPGINCYSGNVLDCSESYPADTIVPLKANPALGSVFVDWSGGSCVGSTDPSCDVTMDSNKTVIATFNDVDDDDFDVDPDNHYTCPAVTDAGGWKAPLYDSPACGGGGSAFDPGCYPPINQSKISQSKAGCLSVGAETAGGLFVDAGAYVSGFLKLPLSLTPIEIEAQKKVGNVLTLTDDDEDPNNALVGVAGWDLPGLACETVSVSIDTNANAGSEISWRTATSICPLGGIVVDGWIKTLDESGVYDYAYAESYPSSVPGQEAWVGRLRGDESKLSATVYAQCCRISAGD